MANDPGDGGPRYFLVIFTPQTWSEFLEAGGQVAGFRLGLAGLARHVRPGDLLLCYVMHVSAFIGVLTVRSSPFVATDKIWSQAVYPLRLRVEIREQLPLEAAVSIKSLVPQFTWYSSMTSPKSWQGHVQNSLREWTAADGATVVKAIEAASNP